jgi:hypothetical protein
MLRAKIERSSAAAQAYRPLSNRLRHFIFRNRPTL